MTMKTTALYFAITAFVLLATHSSYATPDRSVRVHEKMLGTHADGYAIIREEIDNLGNYYTDDRNIWLDEYSKDDASGSKVKTTFLLNQTDSVDMDDGTVKTTSTQPDTPTPTLSDLISRYSPMGLKAWSQDQIKELHIDHKTGHIAYRSQSLFDANTVLKQRFRESHSEQNFSLVSVAEDSNAIFLTISTMVQEGRQERVICVSPSVTRNVRALQNLEPIHLSAGTFQSAEEAWDFKRKLDKDKKNRRSESSVWSVFREKDAKLDYVVILTHSKSFIGKNDRGRMKTVPEVTLVPITSDHFRSLIVDAAP
ncbi:hypothetical protein HW115_10080 [Verrucomicrobiaceae bacterium N1E253]|uniref:Uncharacterized protein n=1 Tax=Oceaniferula marina TaxID=2748318 RepID=A0A851GJB6_9BACT|nr:hypothetical protein [Oceaniferula marina]NWK55961.1 hypothetical protein [Oceaniferula marina]